MEEQSFRQLQVGDILSEIERVLGQLHRIVQERYELLRANGLQSEAEGILSQWRQVGRLVQSVLEWHEPGLYPFVGNNAPNFYDILGLDINRDRGYCYDRCDKMAKFVPCPASFLQKCYAGCDDNPDYIPTMPDLMTPPETKPGWDFDHPRGNWDALLDALRALWEKLKGKAKK